MRVRIFVSSLLSFNSARNPTLSSDEIWRPVYMVLFADAMDDKELKVLKILSA